MHALLDNPLAIYFLGGLSFVLLVLAGYFWIALSNSEDKVRELEEAHQKMMRSFNELDEQAKLIIKTDLELNRAQEELEKRLNGLNALQRTSRQISQALNEGEIFEKLKQSLFEDLGFSKTLVVVNNSEDIPHPRTYIGFEESKIQHILRELFKDEFLTTTINEGKTLSSLNSLRKLKERITQIFETEHYILAPIVTQTGTLGFIFVGNRQDAPAITLGDEELITILAGQIGQSIENAQLFDKVFRSSQELEIKVKERTKQLATALSQVEEINKKKTEFLSAVSHELRTPLTSIKGYASILMTGKIGNIPEAVKERLSRINIHSDNLVSLINNLLDITRIESGRVEMHFAPHNTKAVIDNIADLLTPQVTAKEIKLTVNVPAEVPEIYIDPSQAERILINLLSNAIKFTPKGGTIGVTATRVEEGAQFDVADSGIGMSQEDLGKLFTEFFRVENEINQTVKGTGLGLVLARDIVHAHRGRIWVKSQVGVGTTFSFTLPTTKEIYEKNKRVTSLA
jgi:signal transduction histidine kinase